jgi:GT2 family glycosyltransferase
MNNTDRPTLCIGIPTINRRDLLDEALAVYEQTFKNRHIYIIDNGEQGFTDKPPYMKFWSNGTNNGVAASWNKIIERQAKLGYTHVLILNDDVILHKKAQELEQWVYENPADLYTGHGYFSFIIPISTYLSVGKFDEKYYPAYYEDTDYTFRLKLAGMNKLDSNMLLPEVLHVSQSGAKDQSLYEKVFQCRRYYEQKWGGAPTQETYTTPFNQ